MPTVDPGGSPNKRLMALGAFSFLLMAAAAAALVYGVIEDPAVSSPIAGAVGVIIAALLQRRWEKQQELERVRREHMAPIYEELVAILQDPELAEKRAEGFFKELTTKLLLYGPAPVGPTP